MGPAPAPKGKDLAGREPLKVAHIAVIVAGVALLSSLSAYSALWFDESYSVALVRHPLGELWRIAASDVHPPLYYYLLKLVWLLFPDNVVAYRLFSVAALGCLSLLGYTHLRRDFGRYVGIAFSFLTLVSPWSFRVSSQIRMYSWAALFVGVCLIYGLRVIRALREARLGEVAPTLPRHWWVVLCLSSAAAANCHYFALMAAFSVNLCVIVALVCARRCLRDTHVVRDYVLTAALACASFAPWMGALLGQAGHVSQYFWIRLDLPRALLQIVCFPFLDSDMASIDAVVMSGLTESLTLVGSLAFVAVVVTAAALGPRAGTRRTGEEKPSKGDACSDDARGHSGLTGWAPQVLTHPLTVCLVVYLLPLCLALLAGLIMNRPILYVRYFYVGLAGLVLAVSLVLARAGRPLLYGAAAAIAVLLTAQTMAFWLPRYHSPQNAAANEFLEAIPDGALISSDCEVGTLVTGAAGARAILAGYSDSTRVAYEAYEPSLTLCDTLDEAFVDGPDELWYLETPTTLFKVGDVAQWFGYRVQGSMSFYRPISSKEYVFYKLEKVAR